MNTKKQLRAVDFFSGAGGLTCGLKCSGIDVIAGIDIDASCKETFEKNNNGSLFLEKDLTRYSPKDLQKDLQIKKNDDMMLFSGCAPCQFWSLIQTDRNKSKKTKNLILEFNKYVEYFMPGFVFVENVPGIFSKHNSPISKFIKSLEKLGYNVTHGVIDMSLYGIPQNRRRFTLLASRISDITLPEPSKNIKTVKDCLGPQNGFSKIPAGTKDSTNFMHTTSALSEINLERIKRTRKNGGDRTGWHHIKKLRLACYSENNKLFYDTYGRMWWDRPSPTITTKFMSISNGRFAHPDEDRGLSIREGATLQTFPEKYKFYGNNIGSIARIIGNAVPPKFAEIIGKTIIKSIN